MQQHYKHKTISKATRRPEVTFQSSCQRSPDLTEQQIATLTEFPSWSIRFPVTEFQWEAPTQACRFRTAHFRTIWIPVPHHTLSHRTPELRFRTINSAPDNFFYDKFQECLAGVSYTTYFNPKRISTKGTGMKNRFIHSGTNFF